MNIALLGATGNAGRRILKELVSRGHTVTAIARRPEHTLAGAGITSVRGDVRDQTAMQELLTGHDAVVHSVLFLESDPQSLIAGVRGAGVKRLLVVGGAGSLITEDGNKVMDKGWLSDELMPEVRAGGRLLQALREVADLEWTFLSPPFEFVPGERSGRYRIGGDQLLRDENGRSWISFEDYAVALVDELERPAHVRARFTVAY
jgi:hypothetical protein